MRIKINEEGFLEIERAGIMKHQFCPPENNQACGDWCPLFGESERRIRFEANEGKEVDMLELCRTTIFGEVIDERPVRKIK